MRYRLIILLGLIVFSAQAQQSGKVKLLNGTVLRSADLRLDSMGNIMVGITPHSNVIIPRETVFKASGRGFKYLGEMPDQSGLYGGFQFGLMFGRSSENSGLRAGAALEAGIGYALNNKIRFGLGSGFQFIEDLVMAPVYLRFEGSMTNARITPIYSLDMGGAFVWFNDEFFNEANEVDGGWLLRPGLGLRFNNLNSSFYILINYQTQAIKYTSTQNWWWRLVDSDFRQEERRVMKNLSYTIGFTF